MSKFVSRFWAAAYVAAALASTMGGAARAVTCTTNGCSEVLTPTIYVLNNEFGNPGGAYGSGSITVNSSTAWSTSWNFPTPPASWGVMTYPAAILGWQWGWVDAGTGLGIQLSSHTPVNTSNNFSVTGNSTQDVSYDMWYHTMQFPTGTDNPLYEVMIWQFVKGGLAPTSQPIATNLVLDGVTWDVYKQTGGASSGICWIFWRHNTDVLAANLNISDFDDWLVNNGQLAGSLYLTSVQFGTEIYANGTGNAQSGTLTLNSYSASVGSIAIPPAPTGLTATAGNGQVALTWNSSNGATSYSVYRGTTSGGESATAIASGLSSTSYTNTGLTNGTTYYYKVKATNSAGTSGYSSEASATPAGGSSGLVSINAGGPAASPFVADTDFSGGTAATNWTGAITTTGLTSPAPQAVYQSERYGASTYTIGGLTANTSYKVRLHFCENYFTASGARTFNVSINGTSELSAFDIYAAAGAAHKGVIKEYTVNSNGSGQEVIAFTNVVNNALINGIEVQAVGGSGNTHGGTWALKGVPTSTGSWKNTWQVATGVATNSTYTASFWMKGSGAAYLITAAGSWGTEIHRQAFTATSTWTQYSYTISTGSNTSLTYYFSDGGGVAGTLYIDDCFLGILNGTNKLANPGFESGAASWTVDTPSIWSILQNP